MGFFSRLANKVGGAVRFGVKHSESIGRLAHKVSGVANRVGNIAAGVAAGAAGTPFAPIAASSGAVRMLGGRGGGVPQLQLGN